MLRIRKEQMDALAMIALQQYYEDMIKHVNHYFPEKCSELGTEKVNETVKDSMIKAKEYGIEGEADMCKYINMVFVFGDDFDVNANLPWANEILTSSNLASSESRMMMLEEAASKHLESDIGT